MENKIKKWAYPFAVISLCLMLVSSCKKDNENNKESSAVTDYDGNVYHTVTIGSQVWMVENLKTTHYRNGDPIPNVPGSTWNTLVTGAYCDYNNNDANSNVYGRLYNWYVIADSRNICPLGWHVPDNNEWITLTNFLGGESIAGGKMKESGTSHWATPNTGATNESGFTALPAGCRFYSGVFGSNGEDDYWWSASEYDGGFAWFIDARNSSNATFMGHPSKAVGSSIRCIKD